MEDEVTWEELQTELHNLGEVIPPLSGEQTVKFCTLQEAARAAVVIRCAEEFTAVIRKYGQRVAAEAFGVVEWPAGCLPGRD